MEGQKHTEGITAKSQSQKDGGVRPRSHLERLFHSDGRPLKGHSNLNCCSRCSECSGQSQLFVSIPARISVPEQRYSS